MWLSPRWTRLASLASPLYLDHTGPRIDGVLDGLAGRFAIDTGSDLSLTLAKSFMERHDLMKKYAGTRHDSVFSAGVGGDSNLIAGRGGLFSLGNVEILQPALELPMDAKGAVNGATTVAGNIGNGVLSQMKVLFDYPHHTIYLERVGGG